MRLRSLHIILTLQSEEADCLAARNSSVMGHWVLRFSIFVLLGFLINENQGWWDSRRRRRRCSPSDCTLSNWSSWGTCSHTCGNGGKQERYRSIIKRQSCGGRCFRFRQTRPCNNICCPVNCVYSWTSWGPCYGVCGTGSMRRNFTVIRRESCGGLSCPVNQTEVQTCVLARYLLAFISFHYMLFQLGTGIFPYCF